MVCDFGTEFNNNLENKIKSFEFCVSSELEMHFESILKKNGLPILYNLENQSYRISNNNRDLIEHDWNLKYGTLTSFNIIFDEYVCIYDKNNIRIVKQINSD